MNLCERGNKRAEGTRGMAWWMLSIASLLMLSDIRAETTIDVDERYAYGSNIGWVDWCPDATSGAAIGEFRCRGKLYSANCGWISLAAGDPTNGIAYCNDTADDWGVNVDSMGRLRGYAYGANIGWIAFESNGAPRVDPQTGVLSGFAWGANVGWISLSNAVSHVRTMRLAPDDDSDEDGLPDAWERMHAGGLDRLRGGDADRDGDGMSDRAEYVAGTDPTRASSVLRVVLTAGVHPGALALVWRGSGNRLYRIESREALAQGAWMPVASQPWRVGTLPLTVAFIPVSPWRSCWRVCARLPSGL